METDYVIVNKKEFERVMQMEIDSCDEMRRGLALLEAMFIFEKCILDYPDKYNNGEVV